MPMYPPLPPVTANTNTALTVSWMLKNPQFFRRRISDLMARRDYMGLIFGDGGNAAGGAAAYQVATSNIFTTQSDVEKIAPGAEYPKVKFDEETLNVITIDKRGGEFEVTDEMRLRNSVGIVEQRTQLLVNAVILKDWALGLSVLTAAISTYSRSSAGNGWATYAALTNTTAPLLNPITEDIATFTGAPEDEQSPYEYDLMIMNPQEWRMLVAVLGNAQKVDEYLKSLGVTRVWVTSLQTAGKIKYVDTGMVGLRFWEEAPGVQTKVYRAEGRDTDIVKAKNRAGYAVTDPLAIKEQTGAAA